MGDDSTANKLVGVFRELQWISDQNLPNVWIILYLLIYSIYIYSILCLLIYSYFTPLSKKLLTEISHQMVQ